MGIKSSIFTNKITISTSKLANEESFMMSNKKVLGKQLPLFFLLSFWIAIFIF